MSEFFLTHKRKDIQRLNKWKWLFKPGREKWLGGIKENFQNPNVYLLLLGSSSAYKITSRRDLHFLSTICIIFCTCAQEPFWCKWSICLVFPDFNIIHLGSPLIVFVPGWRLFIRLVPLWNALQWVSMLSNKNTLPPFSSRVEFSYCTQTSVGTQEFMWHEQQWRFINDTYPAEGWPDLKCMPINLADWKGMVTIESSGQYLYIDCLLMIRVGYKWNLAPLHVGCVTSHTILPNGTLHLL